MYAILNLDWLPSATSSEPPVGRAPAVVRDDPYTHVFVVTNGWALLGSEDFEAQIRLDRLTSDADPEATADFTVTTEQDGTHLHIILGLTAAQTKALPHWGKSGVWDMQMIDGGTLVAGKVKVLDDVTRIAP